MTRAPENLLAVRDLLLTYLNVNKNAVISDALEPGEVGIVGDANHKGGYHCGSDRVVPNDYSVVESTRDSSGLTLDASALDVGMFTVKSGGATHDLRNFSTWCVAQCVAGTADTQDIREIIYSPDGKTVKRWDRLKKRSTGDSSHLIHTHFSFFRDSTKANRDQTPLFRRYLTTIGLLEDDMTPAQATQLANVERMLNKLLKASLAPGPDGQPENAATWWLRMLADNADPLTAKFYPPQKDGNWKPIPAGLVQIAAQIAATRSDIAALSGKNPADSQAIIAGVLAGMTPEKIAAAIPPTLAKDVADELSRRLAA
ncbi:hypothetical protein ACNAW0_21265 [Micromonospora sp. SL1-18]|uniref:hypothetical protein n=1 Tax=Micromonospora sp. SL1-18 TaxID=3399128 RepID=UPI003A4E01CD